MMANRRLVPCVLWPWIAICWSLIVIFLGHTEGPEQEKATSITPVYSVRHPRAVVSLAFLGSSAAAATSCEDGNIRIFDIEHRVERAQIPIAASETFATVNPITASADGKIIYAGPRNSVEAWDSTTRKRLWRTEFPKSSVFISIALSPDSKTVAAQCTSSDTLFLDSQTGKHVDTVSRSERSAYNCAFTKDGSRLLITFRNEVAMLNAKSLKTERVIENGGAEEQCESAWSPDAKRIGIASSDKSVTLRDATTAAVLHRFTGHQGAVTHVVFPDNDTVMTADNTGEVILWDISEKKMLRRLRCGSEEITDLKISPDGKVFGISNVSGDVMIYSMPKR